MTYRWNYWRHNECAYLNQPVPEWMHDILADWACVYRAILHSTTKPRPIVQLAKNYIIQVAVQRHYSVHQDSMLTLRKSREPVKSTEIRGNSYSLE